MPSQPIYFDLKELKEYVLHSKRGVYYSESNKKYHEFLTHSDGQYPQDVIERQRPNEADVVKDFRKEIWQPITKPTFTRVVSSINKIRRSSDWSINYNDTENITSRIANGETLYDYCELDFPFFSSVTNWVFSVLLKQYLIDPNAVILDMPLEVNIDKTEYLKPYPYIFNCCDVLDFKENEYAVLNIPTGSERYNGGKAFYFVNTQLIQKWEQINRNGFVPTLEYVHDLAMLPVFKLGGIICNSNGHDFLYESRISGILPNLNECVAEYTDLQAGKRLHLYPERWEFTQHECSQCKGNGVVVNPNYVAGGNMRANMVCGACSGLGYISGPYSKTLVKPVQAGQQNIPLPPAGFIEKDVEIIKVMDESWRRHIFDALAAINFQFLDQTPLNQSGTAKEVDKEELNNTVHAIAEDLVRIMDRIYLLTARYRYKGLYSFEEIKKMLPSISVPEHFDLLSSQFMQEEVSKAKASKLNPIIIGAMEIEFAGKRFINEPEVKNRVELVLKLDPLPNLTEDDKMTMLSNKGITKINYIISSNIQSFVQRAIFENDKFADLALDEQKATLEEYAEEQIEQEKQETSDAMNAAQQKNQQPEVTDQTEEPIEEDEIVLQ